MLDYLCATLLPNFSLLNSQESYYKHIFTSRGDNSVDPDQLASKKPADLDLHCFENRTYLSPARKRLMIFVIDGVIIGCYQILTYHMLTP